MRCRVVLVGLLLVVVLAPLTACGQGVFPFQGVSFGAVGIRPAVSAGYQKISASFNLPFPPTILLGTNSLHHEGELQLNLRDSSVWTGRAQVDASLGSNFLVSMRLEGSIPSKIQVVTQSDPYYASRGRELLWNSPRTEWWEIRVEGAYKILADVSVIVGGKWEHLSLQLENPPADPQPFGWLYPVDLSRGDRYLGDMLTKISLPYVGLAFSGPGYRARVIGSTLAYVDTKVPFRWFRMQYLPGFWQLEQARYTFANSGGFLGFDAEYDVQLPFGVAASIWAKGTWLNVRGTGTQGYESNNNFGPVLQTSADADQGCFASTTLGVGIQISMSLPAL